MRRYEHGGDIYSGDTVSLDFSVNTNPLGMPESVKQVIISHIPEYTRYPDPRCRVLRSALAQHYGLKAPMLLCGNGASELIFVLCACIKPRRAVTLAPTFSEYGRAATLFGGEMHEHLLLENDGFALTESILAELTPQTDVLFLCNPNNPTGRTCSPALLFKIAKTCRSNGILLVLDECFIDFTRGESMLPYLGEYPNLLILRAFTKIYAMAGLRLGMLYCANLPLLSRIAEYCPEWNVSGVAQIAGLAALKETGWIENTQRLIEIERGFVASAFCNLGLTVYQSDANFLLIKSEKPLDMALRARGTLVRACANFTGLDERYIRIGLKARDENKTLIGAVTEILNG